MKLAENLVVVVCDGLQASHLGPYGNAWIPTPAWNELAAESTTLEWNLADAVKLETIYRSYWHGCHAAAKSGITTPLPRRLGEAGLKTFCLTDVADVASWGTAAGFQSVEQWELGSRVAWIASWEETEAARWAMAATDRLLDCSSPFFAWVHLGAIATSWQAPFAWRERFRDDEDPESPDFVDVPRRCLDVPADPDELLGYSHAYAAEVMLADASLSVFFDALKESGKLEHTAILVTAPRGFALGDHAFVGIEPPLLHSESLQVPALIRCPGEAMKLQRREGIFQSADLYATSLSVLGAASESVWSVPWSDESVRLDRAVACHGDCRVLRTPAWLAVWGGADQFELYVKPDDRWEVNEVSRRRPDIEEPARRVLEDFLVQAERGTRKSLCELPPELVTVGD